LSYHLLSFTILKYTEGETRREKVGEGWRQERGIGSREENREWGETGRDGKERELKGEETEGRGRNVRGKGD
jgi:hypothetical protein